MPHISLAGLEEAGGLEWVGKYWRTTEAGRGGLG
jgi:hypothetical protein